MVPQQQQQQASFLKSLGDTVAINNKDGERATRAPSGASKCDWLISAAINALGRVCLRHVLDWLKSCELLWKFHWLIPIIALVEGEALSTFNRAR